MKTFIRISIALLLLFESMGVQASCVVLLHGLARSDNSMKKMENQLLDAGFTPVNMSYPSRDFSIETLAIKAIEPAVSKCPEGSEINFVTHSLGGILVRQYLKNHVIENMKRVVMLGPPNKGSEVVDKLRAVPGFQFINGDAGMQLGTGQSSVPNSLGKATFDVGIVAGSRSINLFLSFLIPGKDDGKVSIENTKLNGMNDHLTMPVTHPFMMKNDKVIEQVIYYFKNGKFRKD
ncbi:MAG: hypothetical protein JKY24_02905 [Pseudomonadales bacterium]|nr:hypothetical protein [Pseudomonadales bacterium]